MELILKRIAKKKGYTIGRLYFRSADTCSTREQTLPPHPSSLIPHPVAPPWEGMGRSSGGQAEVFLCNTLEPQWRNYKSGAYKVKGRSAIPEGRYAVVISWSPKMKQWLPILLGVPMFSGIRIHAGNTAKDTKGCILVGVNREVGMVLDSCKWVERIKRLIVEAKDRGEPVWITIE